MFFYCCFVLVFFFYCSFSQLPHSLPNFSLLFLSLHFRRMASQAYCDLYFFVLSNIALYVIIYIITFYICKLILSRIPLAQASCCSCFDVVLVLFVCLFVFFNLGGGEGQNEHTFLSAVDKYLYVVYHSILSKSIQVTNMKKIIAFS